MSDMKCPLCGQELKKHLGGDMPEVWCCDNKKCKLHAIGGDIELWQTLIDTKKKLDYAITMLERIAVSPETILEPEKIIPQLAAQAIDQINKKEEK